MEIEVKFALTPAGAAALRKHPLLGGAEGVRERLHTVYYDTPDFALLRHEVALRLRRKGRRWVQTLKARTGSGGLLAERPEWETAVIGPRPEPALLPPQARACLPEGVEGQLAPVFETAFWRRTWTLQPEGAVIELALDQGEVRAGESAWPILELELELKSGRLDDLFDVAQRLAADLPVRLEPRSKAQRGYQLAGALTLAPVKASLPALALDGPAGAAFVAIARACMRQFEANLPGYLAAAARGETPDPEYVHQMRVSMRRLRAAVGLLRFMAVAPPEWVDELRWLMGELGQARDWDVFVTETLPRVEADLGGTVSLAPLLEVARRLRQAANARAEAALTDARLARLWLAMERSLAAFPPTPMSARAWAVAALDRRYRRIKRLGKGLQALDAAGRHALRIAGKKLRYAAEFFSALRPKAARRFSARLAELQDVLGVLNDAAVTAHLLEQAKATGGAAVLEAAGAVSGYLACAQQQRLRSLAQAWAEFRATRGFWREEADRAMDQGL
ncbi:MAG: CHAD domain-containing protein [Thiobacillaceae bacterium]|nr:CHAD domain-containing protein [Thiobacillaceae bacterium]